MPTDKLRLTVAPLAGFWNDAVNVAARLQGEARLGEVLISGTTWERVAGRFDVEYLGERHVRGRTQSIARFLDYVLGHDRVWVPRRIDIARHWHENFKA